MADIAFLNTGIEGSAASGNITPGAPATPANDDIWICVCHVSERIAATMDAAWTQIFDVNGGGTTSRLAAWWFRYAGSDPSRVVTVGGGSTTRIAGIAAFRNCETSGSPIDTVGATGANTTNTLVWTGITPGVAGCMLFACGGTADDNSHAVPSGMAVTFNEGGFNRFGSSAGTPDGGVVGFWELWTSGATGNRSEVQQAADPWTTVLIALKPPTAAPSRHRKPPPRGAEAVMHAAHW